MLSEVKRAMCIDFGAPVTGYLCFAKIDWNIRCLLGVVYLENRGRFRDGATIRTSVLKAHMESAAHHVFETVNGSIYVVCSWSGTQSAGLFPVMRH